MRRIVLIVILLCLKFSVYGQARIGFTEKEFLREFPYREFGRNKLDDGHYVLTWANPNGNYIDHYIFSPEGKCVITVIEINERAELNRRIEFMNKNYMVISNYRWLFYTDSGSILSINLEFSEELKKWMFTIMKHE
jgi:hypothetical protein